MPVWRHGPVERGIPPWRRWRATAASISCCWHTIGATRPRPSCCRRYAGAVRQGSRIRVATKFTRIARDHFADKGVHVDIIKLYGSMELAPLTGLADAIVDLVSSGNTLKANHLVEVERIMPISARLIVNQAALKLKRPAVRGIVDALAKAVTPP